MGWRGEIDNALTLDGSNWRLFIVGALLIVLGVAVPGTQPEAVTGLILVGSGLTAIAMLAPAYREIEIGLTKFRLNRGESEAPAPWLVAEADTMVGIARRTLGDAALARSIVEDVLTQVRRESKRISRDDREVVKLRWLVARLHKADQQRVWGDGQASEAPNETMEALRTVDFDARVAFALCSEFQAKEVASVLECSESEAKMRIERAESAVSSAMSSEGTQG